MRRVAGTAAVLATLLLVTAATPAFADNPGFSRHPGGVSVTVSQAASPAAYSEGGGSSGIECRYVKEDLPTDGDISHQGEEGQWYAYWCGNGADLWLGNLWVPAAQPAVAPAALAQLARRYLPLPPPSIQLNPPAGRDHLVNLESWLWVDPATWGQRSATASVPNESATVVATPVSVTWKLGDGGQVTCQGPGVPYDMTRPPASQRTTCAYTYQRSSAGRPGDRYTVSATTTWSLSWTATGVVATSGTLPALLRTSTTTVRVAEAQAIN
jgi:hypothetical protein